MDQDPGGKYHFTLVAGNGQVIATSTPYERRQAALNGIESLKRNAPDAEIARPGQLTGALGPTANAVAAVLAARCIVLRPLLRVAGLLACKLLLQEVMDVATGRQPEAVTPVLGRFEAPDRRLHRAVGLWRLLFLGVSAQIGSGWLFAVLKAAGVAGPAATVSWLVGGVLMGLIALAFAELATMLPRSGAIVRYPYLSHGPFTGWIIGWGYWLSAVSIPPIEAEAVLTYIGGRFPGAGLLQTKAGVPVLAWPWGILCGIGLMIIFFAINFVGVRLLSESNFWVTVWKLVIPTATFCFLFVIFRGSNFTAFGGFAPHGAAAIFHALGTSGIIFSMIGIRQALDFGGEARNPQRDIPLATCGSILIPVALYIVLQVAFLGALNWHSAGLHPGDWAGLTGSSWASGPFFHALDAAGIAALASFGTVLLIDAGISPSGTGLVYLGTATRSLYGLSIHRNLPRVFERVGRLGIPWLSLTASLVIGCLFFIPAPSWYQLVGFISAAAVMTFVTGGVGLQVLRRTAPALARPFRLPAAWLWAPVGFLAATEILYWSGFTVIINVVAATFIGLPIFTWYYAWRAGWTNRIAGAVLGVVFLAAWIYINRMGGWVLTASGSHAPGGWSFGVYDSAFSAAVVAFCVALALLSNRTGRRHVAAAAWFIFLLLATLPLSYYGHYGPLRTPPVGFPWGVLIEAGIGLAAYFWGVRSGFLSEEMREILATQTPHEPTAETRREPGEAA